MTDHPLYRSIPVLDSPASCFSLAGKVGLITGGAGKMGQAFVRILNAAGASVVIADLESSLESAAPVFGMPGAGPALAIPANVSKESEVKRVFSELDTRFGQIDFMIHNVMAKPKGYYASTFDYAMETWDSTVAGNLSSGFLCAREAARHMKKHGTKGSIVITSSIYGMVGPDQRIYENCSPRNNPYDPSGSLNAPASYSASKAGLIGLAKHLATLLGPDGIRVNVFVPGGVFDDQEEAFHKEYIRRVPLGRMGTFSDYSGAILFLVSEASRYMTGGSLVIDGGWTAW